MDSTKIEWTDATWNPITGCTLVSEGRRNCYAATLAATRLKHHPSREGLARVNAAGEAKFTGEVRFNEGWLDQPCRWRKPRMIFVCAHGDLFHESVPDEWIDRVFAVMAQAGHHTFQVLTKRPERARDYISTEAPDGTPTRFAHIFAEGARAGIWKSDGGSFEWPLPNVWLGTSVEDQATTETRIPHLLATPATVRFVSAEPLLGPVDMENIKTGTGYLDAVGPFIDQVACGMSEDPLAATLLQAGVEAGNALAPLLPRLDWIILGGESGARARPMHPDWARSLRDQCQAAGVAFFFKQWGEWAPGECCDHSPTKSEHVAWWWNDDWSFDCLTPGAVEHMHRDDAPDLFRIGKRSAGRLLDGREWNEVPE